MGICGLLKSTIDIRTEYASLQHVSSTKRLNRNENTHGCSSANQLALAAQPLALRYKRDPITLLMHCEVAAVTEDNSVGVFAVAIVAYRTLCVLFFAIACRFSVDCCCRARSRSMGLRRLRVWLGDSLDANESAISNPT